MQKKGGEGVQIACKIAYILNGRPPSNYSQFPRTQLDLCFSLDGVQAHLLESGLPLDHSQSPSIAIDHQSDVWCTKFNMGYIGNNRRRMSPQIVHYKNG